MQRMPVKKTTDFAEVFFILAGNLADASIEILPSLLKAESYPNVMLG